MATTNGVRSTRGRLARFSKATDRYVNFGRREERRSGVTGAYSDLDHSTRSQVVLAI